jgi:hypothetical protein
VNAARVVVPTALLAAVLGLPATAGSPATAGAGPGPRVVPGLTGEDTHPGACVDCHVDFPERGMDARLSVWLARWTRGEVEPRLLQQARASAPPGVAIEGRHPEASDSLGDIPGACLECHGTDAREAPPFARLIHLVHLEGGAQNHFMTVFQGECTLCHKLDARTGQWIVPSEPEARDGSVGARRAARD